ncbi:MAG: helix-turn-helix domain-containing protein [Rhodobacteraceae bacterium]|nr:helix-turn-helix domain-containing protein [Paracoccaceae bacterium]
MHSALHFDAGRTQSEIRVRIPRRRTLSDPVTRRIQAGQHLFHERDSAHFVYQIASGVVRLTRLQKDGRRQVIAFGFPGDVVGLPADGRHTTECDAISPCEVVAHRCANLMQPERDPDLHRFLMQSALDDIRFLQDHFLMLGRRLALEKTAAFLELLLDRIGEPLGAYTLVRLPMNRSDIADYLGLTPETVSRAITELRTRKVVALDDANTMIVLDDDALRELADGT